MRRLTLDRILSGALVLALVGSDLLQPAVLVDLTIAMLIVLGAYVIVRPSLARRAGRWALAHRRPPRRTAAVAVAALVLLASPFLIRGQSPLAFVPRAVGQAEDATLWSHVQLADASYIAEGLMHGSAGFPARGDTLALVKAQLLHARFDAAILALRSTAPPSGGKVLRLAILPIYERISLAQTQLIAAEQGGIPSEIGLHLEYLALLHGRLAETLKLLAPPASASRQLGHLASPASVSAPAAAACPPRAATQTTVAGAGFDGPVQLLRTAGADYLTPGLQIYGNPALNASALDTYEAARSSRIAFLQAQQDALSKQLQMAGDRLTRFDAAARQQDVTALLAGARETREEARRTAREEMWGVVRAVPYIGKSVQTLGMSQDVIQGLEIGQDIIGAGFDAAAAGTAFGALASNNGPARLEDYASAAKVVVGASIVADKVATYVALRGVDAALINKDRLEFFKNISPWITAADIGFSVLTWAGAEYWADSADQTVHQLDEAHARVTDYRAVLSSAVAELELERDANASELNALTADCAAVAAWRADLAPPLKRVPVPVVPVPVVPAPVVPVPVVPAPVVPAPVVPAPVVPAPVVPAPVAGGTITLTGLTLAPCPGSTRGYITGMFDCRGTVTLNIQRTISSGYVFVVFGDAEFHGGKQVDSGVPGTVTIDVVAPVQLTCRTDVASSVTVLDGQIYNTAKPLVVIPALITQICR